MLSCEFGCVGRARALASFVVALAASFPLSASAQAPATPADQDSEAAPSDEPRPRINLTDPPRRNAPIIDLSTPEPLPPETRTFHQHEGFYVRVDGGAGVLLGAHINAPGPNLSSGGVSMNYDVFVGGSPAPGFSLGGGLVGGLQLSGDWENEAGVGRPGGNLTTLIIGPFADGYPEPKGGWHMGGLAGLAWVGFDAPVSEDRSSAVGFGGAFWTGYDAWVGPDWSVGGLVRLDALRAMSSDDDTTVSEIGLSLMFSVSYN
jgi:hypothetical protein